MDGGLMCFGQVDGKAMLRIAFRNKKTKKHGNTFIQFSIIFHILYIFFKVFLYAWAC
jgi:hypothetical protein